EDRGLGGWIETCRTIAWPPSRPGAVRGGVFRYRADHRRLPARRSPRAPAGRRQAALAPDFSARAREWPARRRSDRQIRRCADPARARRGQRVRGVARYGALLVSLPPHVRGPAAARAAAERARRARTAPR